jgi:hypothetical protein
VCTVSKGFRVHKDGRVSKDFRGGKGYGVFKAVFREDKGGKVCKQSKDDRD